MEANNFSLYYGKESGAEQNTLFGTPGVMKLTEYNMDPSSYTLHFDKCLPALIFWEVLVNIIIELLDPYEKIYKPWLPIRRI